MAQPEGRDLIWYWFNRVEPEFQQDSGRSVARDKTDKRLAFPGLLASIERGEISTLYAYSADRLARSVRWASQLLDACDDHGTTIVTSEGKFASRRPSDRGAGSAASGPPPSQS